MSRKASWGVALGAALLFSVTGCAQQPGQAGAGAPTDVCGLLAAPVTALLVQNGITATPVKDGASSACRWQDQASATMVTLTSVAAGTGEKDAEATNVPGVGRVNIVSPGEVTFAAGGKSWDLKVESKRPDDADTATATSLCSAIGTALGTGASPATAPNGGTAGTQQKDSTVTVTDDDGYKTDLRTSTVRVLGDESIDLENGQNVPLAKVARFDFADSTTGTDVKATLIDGSTVTGKTSDHLNVTGDSDFGAFSQYLLKLKTVEFRRDTPFVATPRPQLPPLASAKVTVSQADGTTTTVKAQTLRFLGDEGIDLENGQNILIEDIVRIDAQRPDTRGLVRLDIALVTGKKISGDVSTHISVTGDTATGPLNIYSQDLKSITIDRGAGTS